MNAMRSFFMFIARILIAAAFLFGGLHKWLAYDETVKYMASVGFTAIPFFLIGASLVEVLGSIALILGFKTRIAAAILAIFLIPTTIIFHAFWNLGGVDQQMAMMEFTKNLSIMGGLLYVICNGSGGMSCDAFCGGCCKKKEPVVTKETDKTAQ